MKRFLSALAVTLMAFTACVEVKTPAEITIPDPESQALFNSGISFPATAESGIQTVRLSFVSTVDWSAAIEDAGSTKSAPWLTIDPSSGEAGPATITVTARNNTDKEARSAKITIVCDDVTKSVSVTQAGQQEGAVTVALDKTELTMVPGQSEKLIATVVSNDPVALQIRWSSSNPSVATVAVGEEIDVTGVPFPCGVVTAVNEGETLITASAGNSEATCKVTVVNGNVSVTEITLDEKEVHMTPGQSVQITATVKPEDAAGSVSWSSSHADVASVDQEGNVTAKAFGETLITATAGDKSANCLVKVEEEVAIEGITLNETSLALKEGDTFQLIATLHPKTATPKPVEWVSSIPAVATVDENGLVTAVRKGGPAMIWAIVNKGTYLETAVKCEVTVTGGDNPGVESITVTPATVSINMGEETILTATVTPDGTGAEIKWHSDNTAIAEVVKISDTQAKVTGVGVGHVKVIASVGDIFDYCEVSVEKKTSGGDVSVSLNKTELQLGFYETAQLVATVTPAGAADELSVTWTSSNEDIVLVSNGSTPGADGSITPAGTVIAKNREGEAIVTAKAGDKTATCHVTVKNSTVEVTGISLNKNQLSLAIGQTEQLTATVMPSNATGVTVNWSSSSPRVASVSNGLVVAQSEGEAVITAQAGSYSATCTVVVGSGSSGSSTLESASVNPSSLTLQLDEQQTLTLVMVPADAEVVIYWESANAYIASVQMISKTQAKVKGVSVGQTTVTVHAGDKTATCAVTVEDPSGTSIPVESVSLNKTELTMAANTQFQLAATVLPENATNKEVVWSSSAPSSKLYIDANGMLTALAECEATITVRCKSNAYISATCHVTVTGGQSGSAEIVDLGLSVKWGSMNVGASKPEDYGNYYAWGETGTKSSYTWSNYKYNSTDKYGTGVGTQNKTVLDAEDDAATVNLGEGWRTPTNKEWKELREQCTWKWTTRNGVNGMQVTGPSGNNIFLPAAGYYRSSLTNRGSYGSYWTASYGSNENALAVDFINSDTSPAYLDRSAGLSVRPVKD